MASGGGKRTNYASTTDSDSDCSRSDGFSQFGMGVQKRTRQPKSFSRNAQIARQNRLKKKMYIETLEKEIARSRTRNKKVEAQLKEQTNVIRRQEREIRYMKNVLANSGDISRLLRCINTNTGMCVGTSINRSLTLINGCTEAPQEKDHPWSENYTSRDALRTSEVDDDFENCSFINIPSDDYNSVLTEPVNDWSLGNIFDDHAYTMAGSPETNEEDAGVCLHISKHKVALEFCATCNDNASSTWSGQ